MPRSAGILVDCNIVPSHSGALSLCQRMLGRRAGYGGDGAEVLADPRQRAPVRTPRPKFLKMPTAGKVSSGA